MTFLLTQLGTEATAQFTRRIGELGLTPPQMGMLGMIGSRPGLSQQDLAGRLGLLPSRVVSFIDDFEARALVTRTRSSSDRRVYELTLTTEGERVLDTTRSMTGEQESVFCEALDTEEYELLGRLLQRLAESNGLTPGVHPGYQQLS